MKLKAIIIVLVIVIAASSLVALLCYEKYNDKWILGKSRAQIEEQYGEFESYTTITSPDGEFCYSIGSYLLKPEQVGFLGTTPATYFDIKFNSDGIAYACYEEMAGKGG